MADGVPPDYGMPITPIFVGSEDEKTFQFDENLPSLPVPALDQTLAKYLRSVEPHLSKEEFLNTQRIVQEFGRGVGKELHLQLLERSKHYKNWLEHWWEKYGYLSLRIPHAPYVNFGGPTPYSLELWPPKKGTQVERAALTTWYMLKFWEILRRQRLRVDRGGKQTVWCMHQFRRMYNSCKTPGETVDDLNYYFKTDDEGGCPSHMLVICKGRYFTFDVLDDKGFLITSPEIELQLRRIRSFCDARPDGSCVGALTAQNRTTWFQLRKHLINIHPENERLLKRIQTSIFAIVLDDRSPTSMDEISREALIGNARLRWFDKSMSCVIFENGMVVSNCDHAPHDAMINVVLCYFVYTSFEACNYTWLGPKATRVLNIPEELEFHVDDKIIKAVSEADQLYRFAYESIEFHVRNFTPLGKNFIRKFNLHPDAFVQMAMQFGYYRLHHKPAPTYETASTRKFYNGRTETLRSCTMESLNWSKAMLDPSASNVKRLKMLRTAIDTHIKNMAEACENQGCDRHLFGLQMLAVEKGLPIPEIYLDKAFTKSGGGGNYILSTSCVGYTPVFGGVAPMCQNGYGFFYSIEPERINFYVACWTADEETSAPKLYESVTQSLLEMKKLLESTAEARL